MRRYTVTIVRIIFGIIYLGGAATNIMLAVINGPESYFTFAERSLIPFYRDTWAAIVVPNMILFIALTIAFEIFLGLLFIINREYMKIALVLGIIFCLGTTPFFIEAVYTNIPLALIQAFLLWREFRQTSTVKET